MSQSPRMPLARADAAATLLLEQWRMNTRECMVAGSIRRRAAEVGDIDLVAPLPPEGGPDPLFETIDATVQRPDALFGSDGADFTTILTGLKPRFKIACVVVTLTGVLQGREEEPVKIPVQISRYAPSNRGWVELMKTGPTEFNVWFLAKWKERYQIRPRMSQGNPDGNALIHNHLVDAYGKVVPVGAEPECFEKLGITFVRPEARASHPGVARVSDGRERDRVMR